MFVNRTFVNPTGHGPHTVVTVTNKLLGHKRRAIIPSRLMNGAMIHSYLKGRLVQEAFPTLNAAEREFIQSGMDEWEQREFFDGPHEEIRFKIVYLK